MIVEERPIMSSTQDDKTQLVVPVSSWKRFGALCFAIVAVGPLIGAILGCIVRPDLLAALTLVPPWFWVLLGLASVAVAVRTQRRRWTISLILVWLCFSIGWVEEVRSLSRSMKRQLGFHRLSGTSIRVVSLNCANTSRCLEDLKAARPDIALLQEIPGADELQRMAFELYGEEGSVLAGFDTAILTHGKIEPRQLGPHSHFVSGVVTFPDRVPIHCISLRLTSPVSRLDVWTAGFWTDHRDRRDTHRLELQQVSHAINLVDSWVDRVVGGDFNTVPLDRSLDGLGPAVRDAFPQSGIGFGGTGTNDYPLFRVDQIWVNLPSEQVYSQKTEHSDHRMVVCEIASPVQPSKVQSIRQKQEP